MREGMLQGVARRSSQREMIAKYLADRAVAAFIEGDDEEAFTFNAFAESVEAMSDDEFAESVE